jgi:hypothetical protein
MEYVEGETLDDKLKAAGSKLGESATIDIRAADCQRRLKSDPLFSTVSSETDPHSGCLTREYEAVPYSKPETTSRCNRQ